MGRVQFATELDKLFYVASGHRIQRRSTITQLAADLDTRMTKSWTLGQGQK